MSPKIASLSGLKIVIGAVSLLLASGATSSEPSLMDADFPASLDAAHAYASGGDDDWSDLDSETEMAELLQFEIADVAADTGKREYIARCEELRIVPVAMLIAKLECEHINLRHHGMGVKGAHALAAALEANTHIKSFNLGDNWFGDEGAAALAAVLPSNATITSLNLAENRIGTHGVRALCEGLKKNTAVCELVLQVTA